MGLADSWESRRFVLILNKASFSPPLFFTVRRDEDLEIGVNMSTW